jgi:hypothetical protein
MNFDSSEQEQKMINQPTQLCKLTSQCVCVCVCGVIYVLNILYIEQKLLNM